MQLEILKYLHDIKTAILSIDEYIGDKKDFSVYTQNKQLRRAVEREIEIIGEAVNNVLKINAEINISNARRIVDARNYISHGYDKIDDTVVWGIICRHLPALKKQVDELLQQNTTPQNRNV